MFQDPQQNSAQAPASQGDGGGAQVDPKILEAIQQAQRAQSQPKHSLSPPPVKPPSMGQNIKEGMAGFIPFIGGAVQQSIKQQRDFQIAEVQSKLGQMNDRYEAAQFASGGDPEKLKQILNQDPILDTLRKDKKFQKGMAKVFGADLMNPEKQNTVYHEAMKKHVKTKQAFDQMKDAHGKMQEAQKKAAEQPPPQPQAEKSNAETIEGMPQKTDMPDAVKMTHLANTMKATVEMLGEAVPKTMAQAGIQALRTETQDKFGRNPNSAEIAALNQTLKDKPIDDLINRAMVMAESGDTKGAKELFDIAREGSAARKGSVPKQFSNTIDLLVAANSGNPEAKQILNQKRAMDIGLAEAKGQAWGAGRSRYMMSSVFDPKTGQSYFLPAFEVANRIKDGESFVPGGATSAANITAAQRFVSEVGIKGTPTYEKGAVAEMRKHLGAFDNAKDKAIFAKILQHAPARDPGQAHLWVSGIMEQAIKEGLSDEGRAMAIANKRLMESMGTMRTMLNLPSTDTSMELTYSLVPGLTPDSKYGAAQLDAIDAMAQNAVNIPSVRPYVQKSLAPDQAAPQQKKQSFQEYLQGLKKGGK